MGERIHRILDLFCGAGAASVGIHRAYEKQGRTVEITGIDIEPQKNYPFAFIQGDALDVDVAGYDAIWASPPCQYYSRLCYLPWIRDKVYWRSIPPTREFLQTAAVPYIIENVDDAKWDMENSIYLCGTMVGRPLFRHRRFESSLLLLQPSHEKHRFVIASGGATLSKRRHGQQGVYGNGDIQTRKTAMGIDWMTGIELSQAILPDYSELLWMQVIPAIDRMNMRS